MALFWPSKRGEKSARFYFISKAAMAFKSWALLAIKMMTYKDEKIICLYIDISISKQKLNMTLVDFGTMVKLISQKLVDN